jgi:hypothetical protein
MRERRFARRMIFRALDPFRHPDRRVAARADDARQHGVAGRFARPARQAQTEGAT